MKKDRIIGILLSLALVLGLMPGMELIAYAPTQEPKSQLATARG